MSDDNDKKKQQEDKQRRMFLTSLLTPDARERLDRIKMVNADKYEAVAELICREADEGFIAQRVTEEQLKSYVETVNNRSSGPAGKVTIMRKRSADDSDDSDYDDL